MPNMSFMLTMAQYLNGKKDVTRRLGWLNLKPGDHFMGVQKGQGLKKGEKVVRLGASVVVSVRRELLWKITKRDVIREGFPELSKEEFITMFCQHNKCGRHQYINRIEFKKL